jgi:hypothetical protein
MKGCGFQKIPRRFMEVEDEKRMDYKIIRDT